MTLVQKATLAIAGLLVGNLVLSKSSTEAAEVDRLVLRRANSPLTPTRALNDSSCAMNRRLSISAATLALAMAAAMAISTVCLVGVSAAHAATFTVNSFADGVDAVPGDGCC